MIDSSAQTCAAARRLRRLTLAALTLLALLTAAAAALLIAGAGADAASPLRVETGGLSGLPGALVLTVTALLLGIALHRLSAMLKRVEEGRSFETAAGLRGFAFYLFLAVTASILLPPLLQLAMALGGDGRRAVTLEIGGGEVLMLFVTGLLFLVARLLDEAQRVADDASQIV